MAGDSDQWARSILDSITKIANSPSTNWNQAETYAGLPSPSTTSGSTWLVLSGSGIWPINKPSGWYYSNGIDWVYLGAYNPVVTGGNVTVTNLPSPASTGEGLTLTVPTNGVELLSSDPTRKGFVLTLEVGIVYIGLGFRPTDSQYTYRMTNHCVVEKDGYTGPVFACAEEDTKDIYITEIK